MFEEVEKLVNGKRPQILPTNIDKNVLPSTFANYFKTKIDKLRNSSSTTNCGLLTHPPELDSPERLTEFTLLNSDKIRSIIVTSPSKSCTLDPIPTTFLTECIDGLLPTILEIINSSIASGYIPDVFKSALVTPIIKKPNLDPNALGNYRPVSNLPFVSKVLERDVLPQPLSHLHSNYLHPVQQSAYRRYHSTVMALLRVHNDILRAVDDVNEALLILLDFSSAFDTIDHCLFFQRLEMRFGFFLEL